MAIIDSFDFEGQTPNAPVDFSGTDNWFTQGGTSEMVASSSAAMHGSLGGLVLEADSFRAVRNNVSTTPRTDDIVLDAYFRIDKTPSSQTYIMSLADNSGGSSNTRVDARITPTRQVVIRNGSTATATSVETLEIDTWYRFSWLVTSSGQTLRVYPGDSTVPYFEISGDVTNNAHTVASFGLITAPSGGLTLHVDSLRVADDWLDPVSPAEPLPTPQNFVFEAPPADEFVSIASSWSAVSGAAGYELEVERLVSGEWVPVGVFSVSGTSISLTGSDGLMEGTTYRGRVRAMP